MLTITALIDKNWRDNPSPPQGVFKWCDPIFLTNKSVELYTKLSHQHPKLKIVTEIFILSTAVFGAAYCLPHLLTAMHEIKDLSALFLARGEFGACINLFCEIHKTIQLSILITIACQSIKWALSAMRPKVVFTGSCSDLLAKIQTQIPIWTNAIEDSRKIESVKQEISSFAGLICRSLTQERAKETVSPENIGELVKAKIAIAAIVEEVAEKEKTAPADGQEDDLEYCAFFKLSSLGIRVDDYQALVAPKEESNKLPLFDSWQPEDFIFIETKLAELGIFSHKDLVSANLLKPTVKETFQNLHLYLKNHSPSSSASRISPAIKEVLQKLDKIALIPLILFSPFSLFCGFFYSSTLTFGTAFLLSFQGYKIKQIPVSELANATFLRRLLWMENAIPQLFFGSLLGRSLRLVMQRIVR